MDQNIYIYIYVFTAFIKYIVDTVFLIHTLIIYFPIYILFITYFALYTIVYVSCNIYCILLCQTSSAFKDLENMKIAEESASM